MEFNRKKISGYIMVATIIFVIVWFNVAYFRYQISSNHQSISEYNLSDEDIIPPADLAMAAFFYPADIYQDDNNTDGYIEYNQPKLKNFPRIIIQPHHGYRRAGALAWESFNQLKPFSDIYRNIILIGPSHQKFDGIALPGDNIITTPLGDIAINQNIINDWQKSPLAKGNQSYYSKKNSLNVQLPFIQKTFKSAKIAPVLYSKVDPEELAELISPYLNKKNVLVIVVADLAGYFLPTADDDQNLEIRLKQNRHAFCSKTGLETSVILAQKYGLVPRLLSASQVSAHVEPLVDVKGWSYDEPLEQTVLHGSELFYHNLRNFVRHHHKELSEVAQKSLNAAPKKRYKVKRKNFNNFLFNRGASFVKIYQNGKLIGGFGEIAAVRAVAADIARNVFHIMNSSEALNIKDKNSLTISLQLLTEPEKIKFSSYDDLLDQIEYGVDGLLLRSGKREGFLLPEAWLEIKDKDEFIKKLKLQAGLSPTYWSKDIRIFRFRAVEVRDDED